MKRPPGFFQGSELPRLLILAVIVVVGWTLVWRFAAKAPEQVEPELVATGKPEPIVADRSVEFETVTDRTPIEFRDSSAYALLLQRARAKSPAELATISRRDVSLPHLWQNPELYRGVPIHLLGTALRVLRYPSKLGKDGWIYEASIITPDATRNPFQCVFEEAPEGLPIGPNVSERVVFNGFFLKIWKYQAGDVARGAPLLVGRIGWTPHEPAATKGTNSTLRWSLLALGAMFVISLLRWAFQLVRLLTAHPVSPLLKAGSPNQEIDPAALDDWVHAISSSADAADEDDSGDER